MNVADSLNRADVVELVNLYHLALTALAVGADGRPQRPGRHARLVWASNAFAREHPDVTPVRAYKVLDKALT